MKYYQSDKLQELINWDELMTLPRYAGGHDDQMKSLFKDSILIAHWNEGDYQGMVATCVKLPNGEYAIYNDYYGSCSGCDSWEDADDESIRRMCIGLSNSAYIFKTIYDIIVFLKSEEKDNYSWGYNAGNGLLNEMLSNIQISRDARIQEILNG